MLSPSCLNHVCVRALHLCNHASGHCHR
jgi:hypothetical protein